MRSMGPWRRHGGVRGGEKILRVQIRTRLPFLSITYAAQPRFPLLQTLRISADCDSYSYLVHPMSLALVIGSSK